MTPEPDVPWWLYVIGIIGLVSGLYGFFILGPASEKDATFTTAPTTRRKDPDDQLPPT